MKVIERLFVKLSVFLCAFYNTERIYSALNALKLSLSQRIVIVAWLKYTVQFYLKHM
jgi:predicted permease